MRDFVLNFALACVTAAALTPLVRHLAWRVGAVDRPDGGRKAHGRPVALLGGLAVLAAIAASVAVALAAGWLPGPSVKEKYVVGILLAAALLGIGGAWDDLRNLPPRRQIIWPLLAVAVIVASGIGIAFVRNPFGGYLHFDQLSVTVLWIAGVPYKITPLADVFTAAWLLGMTYTTKLLDGIDGLVSGMTVIGGLVIAAASMMRDVPQPDVAMLALIVAGAYAGFLVFNAAPASIFLGEAGSTTAGFLLGTLAILSGSKIATTLLVLGLPVFDTAYVIVRRILNKKSPVSGDRSHLHFRLLDVGFSPRQVVLLYWFLAALLGTSTLILKEWEKAAAVMLLAAVALALTAAMVIAYRWKSKHRS